MLPQHQKGGLQVKTNYTTLDSGRINSDYFARLIRVKVAQDMAPHHVVAVYHDSVKPGDGPMFYVSNMVTVEHFSDEQDATQYFLALMDPEEFGDPKSLIPHLKSRDPSKSYRWQPNLEVAKAVEAESFRREVAR